MPGWWTLWISLTLSVSAVLASGWLAPRRALALVAVSGFLLVTVLSALYGVADYFTGRGINESVIYHLKAGMTGAGLDDYGSLAIAAGLALMASVVVAIVASVWIFRQDRQGSLQATGCVIVLVASAVLLHPATRDLYFLQQQASSVQHDVALPKRYIKPSLVSPEEPLNLVVLYLESVERTYLDEQSFPGLVPNISRLEKEATYFTNVQQVTGTGWTIGGMVASQCGIPLMTPGHGNSMSGMPDFLPLAECLGDHLDRQGYWLDFMGGADLSFAGKGQFYRTHGFTRVTGGDALSADLDDPPQSAWGLYDDALLTLFEQRLGEHSRRGVPFGLIGLTLDTHHPEGHMPPACRGVKYADGSNPMLNAVHCSDRLVGRFVDSFRQSPMASNTVLVVMSDHLAMRNTAWQQLEQHPRRNLLMMFSPRLPAQRIDKPGSTLDVAPTLLAAMGHEIDGWGFGRNLFADGATLVEREGSNINAYLQRQRGALSALWRFPGLEEGLTINAGEKTVIMSGQTYPVPALIRLGDDADVAHFIPARKNHNELPNYLGRLTSDEEFIWIDQCRNIHALFASDPVSDESEAALCRVVGSMQSEVTLHRLQEKAIHLSRDDLEHQLEAPRTTPEKQRQRQLSLQHFKAIGSREAVD